MKPNLKNINDQVIAITGASSGIGLATARLAALRGAKLVLVSRNSNELKEIADELRQKGTKVITVAADVADFPALEKAVQAAIDEFGRIDTWVNNAGVSVYGRLIEVPLKEKRRLFDTNFWGVVNGCEAVLPQMRVKGGAIINIGSVLSDRSIPLQGIYSASKHAVKGYTDSLRMEVEEAGLPISVTLIKPAAIDTPYTKHAQSHLETQPTNPGPVYSPDLVAKTILECAENPVRDVYVGGSGKFYSLMETFMPRLADKFMERSMFKKQKSSQRPYRRETGLFRPPPREGIERGEFSGRTHERSLYTSASLHPLVASALVVGGVTLLGALLGRKTLAGGRKISIPNFGRTPSTPRYYH